MAFAMTQIVVFSIFFVLVFIVCVIILRWILGTAEMIRQLKTLNESNKIIADALSKARIRGQQ